MARVLVVDDDRNILYIIETLLQQRGDFVHTAKSGKEATEVLDSGVEPDLIILDLRMPVMDGNEFLTHFFERNGVRPPVVLLSAYLGDLKHDPTKLAAVLEKPFRSQEFLDKVDEVLHRKKTNGYRE